jgi:predicted PurR-regulated permease PerM
MAAVAQPGRLPATLALWVVAVVVALFFLREAKTLLIPIALAVLISYALEPVVAWLERRHVPRTLGASAVLILIVTATLFGVYSFRDDASQLVQSLPRVMERARQMVLSQLGPGLTEAVSNGSSDASGAALQQAASAVFNAAGQSVVIAFLVLFLLLSGHHLQHRLIEIAGPDAERKRTVATIVNDINGQIQRYLLALFFSAAIVGVATWAVLAYLGTQQAAMWGFLAGVFNSIPYFGPVIVSGGLFLVGIAQGGAVTQALQMAGAALVITSLEGWLIAPPLMGRAERMSALVVFLCLLLWTWVWGGWGTILAVPMLVVIKSVADHVDRLKPIGRLMAP